MNRRWRLWLGFALLVAPLFLPAVQWRLIGWVRAEAFYQGRPTSYWDRELRQGTMLRGVGCGERCVPFMTFQPPEPTLLEKWLKQYLDWDVDPGPSLDADSEAIPVLLALLTSDHEIVRILAMEKLGKVGPEALGAVPRLQELAQTTQSLWEYRYAVSALERIDPAAAASMPERNASTLSWW